MSAKVPPAKVVRAIEVAREQLYRVRQRMVPAPAAMFDLVLGAWIAQSIAAAVDLGVADALKDGPLAIDELAERVQADPDALRRLLRALIGKGIFRQGGDGRYALNALGETLRTDVPGSAAGMARFVGSRQHREHWSELTQAVRTGQAQLPVLRGKPAFEYLAEDPEFAEVFHAAMTSASALGIVPVVAGYDFSQYTTIADVGGGMGHLLAAILDATPSARGLLYDLPEVIVNAGPFLAEQGVVDRVDLVEGSFFESVPPGADAYVLKSVIHDWNDEQSVDILRKVRAAAEPDKKVLLVETVIPDGDGDFVGKWIDVEMLLNNPGRERTADEFRHILNLAGFEMTRVVPTASPFSVVEGKAV